jgi:hypothetical protein
MASINSDEKIQQLEAKIADLFFGFKIIAFLFLLVATVGNIVAALSIHQFQQIFQDALPGKPLPGLTLSVIYGQTLIFYLALLWPVIGVISLFLRNQIRISILLLSVSLALALIQSGLVVSALRLPMIGLVNGMSDDSGK